MTARPRSPQGDGTGASGKPADGSGRDGTSPRPPEVENVTAAQEHIAEAARTGRSHHDGGGGRPGENAASPQPPAFTEVTIDSNKIAGYALNPDHPVGGNKYRVINSVTGLTAADAARVEQQIRDEVPAGVPIKGRADEYGQRWAVDVSLTGPEGSITVRTAWILDTGSSVPRLVTISFP